MDATLYVYLNNSVTTYTVTGLSNYTDLYYSSQWQYCFRNYGMPIWEQTTGTYKSFFSANEEKVAFDINGNGRVDSTDALYFLNHGNQVLSDAAFARSAELLTDSDLPSIYSATPTYYSCSISVHHGDQNQYLNYDDFRIIHKKADGTGAEYRSIFSNKTTDFTATIVNVVPDTTYVAYLCGYLNGAVVYHDEITFTTGSAPVLPTVSYTTDLHTINLNFSVKQGFRKYVVQYKKISEQEYTTLTYDNKISDFSVSLTGLDNATHYKVIVETTNTSSETYTILSATIFVPIAYRARLAFDSGSGSGTFATIQSEESTSSLIDVTIPVSYVPTPQSGYAFAGWECDGVTKLPGDTFTLQGSVDNPLHTATAQYNTFPGVRIFDGTDFVTAYVALYDGEWKAAVPYIFDGTEWKHTS